MRRGLTAKARDEWERYPPDRHLMAELAPRGALAGETPWRRVALCEVFGSGRRNISSRDKRCVEMLLKNEGSKRLAALDFTVPSLRRDKLWEFLVSALGEAL